jgi:hypothetical protein
VSYFLSWASFHYFSKFGKYIFKMLNSENEITRRFGATLACQAALENDRAIAYGFN